MRYRMRRLSLAGVGAFAVVVALLFVPVSYETGIGSVVHAAWEAPAAAEAAIAAEVGQLDGLVEYKLDHDGDKVRVAAVFCDVAPAEAEARVKEVFVRCAALESTATGVDAETRVKPKIDEISVATRAIVKLVRANALAAATGGRVRIHVRGASPEEIEQALLAELEAQGFTDNRVDVTTESVGDSLRVTRVEVHAGTPPAGAAGDSTQIEMIITREGE